MVDSISNRYPNNQADVYSCLNNTMTKEKSNKTAFVCLKLHHLKIGHEAEPKLYSMASQETVAKKVQEVHEWMYTGDKSQSKEKRELCSYLPSSLLDARTRTISRLTKGILSGKYYSHCYVLVVRICEIANSIKLWWGGLDARTRENVLERMMQAQCIIRAIQDNRLPKTHIWQYKKELLQMTGDLKSADKKIKQFISSHTNEMGNIENGFDNLIMVGKELSSTWNAITVALKEEEIRHTIYSELWKNDEVHPVSMLNQAIELIKEKYHNASEQHLALFLLAKVARRPIFLDTQNPQQALCRYLFAKSLLLYLHSHYGKNLEQLDEPLKNSIHTILGPHLLQVYEEAELLASHFFGEKPNGIQRLLREHKGSLEMLGLFFIREELLVNRYSPSKFQASEDGCTRLLEKVKIYIQKHYGTEDLRHLANLLLFTISQDPSIVNDTQHQEDRIARSTFAGYVTQFLVKKYSHSLKGLPLHLQNIASEIIWTKIPTEYPDTVEWGISLKRQTKKTIQHIVGKSYIYEKASETNYSIPLVEPWTPQANVR